MTAPSVYEHPLPILQIPDLDAVIRGSRNDAISVEVELARRHQIAVAGVELIKPCHINCFDRFTVVQIYTKVALVLGLLKGSIRYLWPVESEQGRKRIREPSQRLAWLSDYIGVVTVAV